MIEFYLLEQLKAFSEKETLSAAAEELHISQPALSRSMQKLEDKMGIRLFDRQKNRLQLNDNGKLLAKYATKILQEEEEMEEKVLAYDRSKRSITLAGDAPGPIPVYMNLLKKAYPQTELSSAEGKDEDLLNGLHAREYQIIILNHPVDEPDVYNHKAITEHLFMTVLPANPAAAYQLKGLDFADVNGQSFLEYRDVGIWKDIVRNKMPDSRFLIQSEMEALGEIIQASGLAAFATDITLSQPRHQEAKRIAVPFNDPEAIQQFWLICLKENHERFDAFFKEADKYARNRKRIR